MQPTLIGPLIRIWVIIYGPARSRRVRAALDTGASYTILSTVLAERLGYDTKGAGRRIAIATASGEGNAPLISLDAIHAAGYRIPNVQALCLDLPRRLGTPCLLGLSALRHFDLDLHLKSGHLEMRDP